ncbi:MAG: DUF615 domain-containing protein [Bacillota bacterium]|nr:DUF615 domain-containing protein [Bacillota bacterium]
MAKTEQVMEEEVKVKQPESPEPQGSDNQSKKKGIIFGLFALLTALLIMSAVIGGAFFIAIKNNVNGIADKYRKEIQGLPVFSLALPKAKEVDDPNLLTPEDLKKKYVEIKKTKDDLTKQLEGANEKIGELQKIKDQQDKVKAESDKIKKDSDAQKLQSEEIKQQVEAEKKLLEDYKKNVDELVAKGDKAGFKAYYEKLNPDVAQKIYSEIITEQKADSDTKKFAALYETMDASAVAAIFEQLGTAKMDLIVKILRYMKNESSAEVLAAMKADFAAKVSEKLSQYYLASPKPAN